MVLSLLVYSRMASRSHSSSEMVVNLIDDLMLLFYFLRSSSYFLRLLTIILADRFSFEGLNRSLVRLTRPGVLGLRGYSSRSFCSLAFSFSRVLILVLSFIFSDERKLFFSTIDNRCTFEHQILLLADLLFLVVADSELLGEDIFGDESFSVSSKRVLFFA